MGIRERRALAVDIAGAAIIGLAFPLGPYTTGAPRAGELEFRIMALAYAIAGGAVVWLVGWHERR